MLGYLLGFRHVKVHRIFDNLLCEAASSLLHFWTHLDDSIEQVCCLLDSLPHVLISLFHCGDHLLVKGLVFAEGGISTLGNFLIKLNLLFGKHVTCTVAKVLTIGFYQFLETSQCLALAHLLIHFVSDRLQTRSHGPKKLASL